MDKNEVKKIIDELKSKTHGDYELQTDVHIFKFKEMTITFSPVRFIYKDANGTLMFKLDNITSMKIKPCEKMYYELDIDYQGKTLDFVLI